MLATGMGLTLNQNTLLDGDPLNLEMGVLLPQGPNLYRLTLCQAEEARFPLTNERLVLINPRSTDPQVGQLAILVGSQTLVVTSGQVGDTILSFEAALVNEMDQVGSSQTLAIQLHVTQCGTSGPIIDLNPSPVVPEPAMEAVPASVTSNPSPLTSTPPSGQLLSLGGKNYVLGACRGLRYNYDFDSPALVRQVSSQNKRVANLVLYTQPAHLLLITVGRGTTLVSFQADIQEFPTNTVRWQLYTIQVTVNSCTPFEAANQITHEIISLSSTSTSSSYQPLYQPPTTTQASSGGSSGGVTGTVGGTSGGSSGGGSGASVIGGGSLAVSQALQAGAVTFTGDHDEALGTTSDDGTSFAAHVELNQGDTSNIFVRLSNQGQGDIAYVMSIPGTGGVSVSATPTGDITQFARTGVYTWKFLLPGGVSSADTGIKLTLAIPDAAPTGFYSLGAVTLRPVNV